jgi:predicted alpha/beta-hydrolase family hydrolase
MSTSYLETTFGSARIISHHHHKKTVAFITHGAGKGLDSVDLAATIHHLNNHGISVVGVEMPWLVSGKKIASPAKQLDQVWIEVMENLHTRYAEYKKIFIGRSTGARVICRTAAKLKPNLIINLAFPLRAPNGKTRHEELIQALETKIEMIIIQGQKDSFGSATEIEKAVGVRKNLEVIDAGNLTHKLSSAVGEIVIECLNKKDLVDRQGNVGL